MPKTAAGAAATRRRARPKTGTLYQVKVTLLETDPPIWRRLLMPGNTTLDRMHDILQAAMGWMDYHLHWFKVGEHLHFAEPSPEWEIDILDERRVRLQEVAQHVGDRFIYEYDLGDSWEHEILVEKIRPLKEDGPAAACLGGERACPPEDAGGVQGYYDKLEELRDPGHEEHESTKTWMESMIGGPFDPDRFDIGATNAALCRLTGLKKAR